MTIDHRWNELGSTLKKLCATGNIRYTPNVGNAGDGLIASAALKLFGDLGIRRNLEIGGNVQKGDVFIYGGGGGLLPLYTPARVAVEKALRVGVSAFVLLPHTVRGHEDLFARMDDRFHIFCREKISFSYLQEIRCKANVYLSHDLALSLVPNTNPYDIDGIWSALSMGSRPRKLYAYLKWCRRIERIRPESDGILRLMRTDVESQFEQHERMSIDLSAMHSSTYEIPAEADLVTKGFFRVLSRADHVISDRLHVCIGATLLGKKVTMLDNSYGKNSSIYEHSLKDLFKNVTLA
ncbi:polysaccharide pyruvyl transferase family protein [Burkholderia sp. Bp8998]|uniref:polysaccharide pyruvyl transferase family protein n=1 Tax=Burkholderia sp. Bp8998 TaxID=2184557 RepID=UPI000F5B4E24|nr:polysaccharide pyruvyl transferase family protein [Burkholderia sp. Bp8998]RQS08868.1 polysaccharide pyruvyl transferase family protein [Burkholderia sp. Bp8998]